MFPRVLIIDDTQTDHPHPHGVDMGEILQNFDQLDIQPVDKLLGATNPPAADPTFVKVLNGVRAEGLKRLWEAELQGPSTPARSARFLGGLNPPSRAVFFGPKPPTLDALLALPTVHGCRRWGVYLVILVPRIPSLKPVLYVGSGTGVSSWNVLGRLVKIGGLAGREASHNRSCKSKDTRSFYKYAQTGNYHRIHKILWSVPESDEPSMCSRSSEVHTAMVGTTLLAEGMWCQALDTRPRAKVKNTLWSTGGKWVKANWSPPLPSSSPPLPSSLRGNFATMLAEEAHERQLRWQRENAERRNTEEDRNRGRPASPPSPPILLGADWPPPSS